MTEEEFHDFRHEVDEATTNVLMSAQKVVNAWRLYSGVTPSTIQKPIAECAVALEELEKVLFNVPPNQVAVDKT